jgi:hypothetical protein
VLVGATCPESAVGQLFSLLPDSGGLLLVPVDTDLRLYRKEPGGKSSMRTVSSVRFQDLEVGRGGCGVWVGGGRGGGGEMLLEVWQ